MAVDLVAEYLHVLENSEGETAVLLRRIIADLLSPQEQETFRWVQTHPWCTSADLQEEFGLQANHAGNLLKRLTELGMLKRREGPPYEYQSR